VRGSETVLVVEDDEAVRECSVEFLSSVGYRVIAAASGEEAVAVAGRHKGKIDLMLADVVMPGVNGAKLALSLTESQPDMKVLFVSGHGGTVARLTRLIVEPASRCSVRLLRAWRDAGADQYRCGDRDNDCQAANHREDTHVDLQRV